MTKLPDIDWCEVPAGEFIMGEKDKQHTLDLPYSYKAAKYPLTNAQYGLFVDAGGYGERRYWTAAGGNGRATAWGRVHLLSHLICRITLW